MFKNIVCFVCLLLISGCGAESDKPVQKQVNQQKSPAKPAQDEAPPVTVTEPSTGKQETVEKTDQKANQKKGDSKIAAKTAAPLSRERKKRLFQDLNAKKPSERDKAIISLTASYVSRNKLMPAFLKMLDDEEPVVAETARKSILSMSWRSKPVLVDFYADWCGPCQIMKPIVKELQAEGYPIIQVDVDAHPELSREFYISSIPTFGKIVDGRFTLERVGVVSKDDLLDLLKKIPQKKEKPLAISPEWKIYGPLLQMSSENAWTRYEATRQLVSQREAYLPLLIKMVRSPATRASFRLSAIKALEVIVESSDRSPEVLSLMNEIMNDKKSSEELWGTAVLFLSRHSPQSSSDVDTELFKLLKNSKLESLKLAAIEEVGNRKLQQGLPVLIEQLKNLKGFENTSEEFRTAVIDALGQFGAKADAAVPTLLTAYQKLPDDRDLISESLENICPESKTAATELIKLLDAKDEGLRELAVTLLEEAEYVSNASKPLQKLLNDKNLEVSRKAAILLNKIGGAERQIVSAMIKTLDEEELNWEIRSIFQSGWKHSIPELVKVVCNEKSSKQAKLNALDLLDDMYQKPGPTERASLETALEQSDPLTKQCAAIVLSSIDSEKPEIVPLLMTALKSDSSVLRGQSAMAIRTYLKELSDHQKKQVTVALIDLLEDSDDSVRDVAASRLKHCELSADQVNHIVSLLKKPDFLNLIMDVLGSQKTFPQAALKPLFDIFQNDESDEYVVIQISKLFGKAGKPALKILGDFVADSKADVKKRAAATEAIGIIAITEPEAVPLLTKALKQDVPQIRIAAANGLAGKVSDNKPLIPLLLTGIQSENWESRRGAIKSLQTILSNSPDAFNLVMAALDGMEPEKQNSVVLELYRMELRSDKLRKRLITLIQNLVADDPRNQRNEALRFLIREDKSGTDLLKFFTKPAKGTVQEIQKKQLITQILTVLSNTSAPIPDAVIPELEKLLNSPSRRTILLATRCLLKSGSKNESLFTIVNAALQANDEELRWEAISALERAKSLDSKYVPDLITMLNNRETRSIAIEQLGKMGPAAKPAIPALIELLDTVSYYHETAMALEKLGETAAPAISALQAKLKNQLTIDDAARALLKIEKDHQPTIAILTDNLDNPDLRANSCVCLGYFAEVAPELVEPLLLKVANTEDPYDRSMAITALGSLKTKSAVMLLIKILKEEDSELANDAALSLGKLGIEADISVPALIKSLDSKNSNVRYSAASALGAFGEAGQSAVPVLLKALNGEKALDDERLRYAAARSLGRIGSPAEAAIPRLIQMLDDKETRRVALQGLTKFGPLASAAVPKLKSLEKKSSDYELRMVRSTLKAIEADNDKKTKK